MSLNPNAWGEGMRWLIAGAAVALLYAGGMLYALGGYKERIDDLTRRVDLVEPALVEIKVDISAIKEDIKAVRDVVAPRPLPQDYETRPRSR